MEALTLDQFAVFLAIVEEGSFAAAARKLGRAQSAVTYAVQKLEDQSGVELFDRSSYRPALTDEGRALLPRVRRIMDDLAEFRVQAQAVSKGVEAELVLLLETFLPLSMFTLALRRFHAEFPMVQLRIITVQPQDATQQLINHHADLGLFLASPFPEAALESRLVTKLDLVAVAPPDHPLAQLPPQFPKEAMRDHLQIVVSNPKATRHARDYGVIGVNQWHVSEMRLRYDLVKQGLGWGSMPRPMVEADLAQGTLVELYPAQWGSSNVMPSFKVEVSKLKANALGPAGTFLFETLSASPDD
ncbi:LysR family transcriptional regulator [Pacificibacter maritimus]|uniref:LysR family transcriptional regulator n=1 Tax=Pacificibacter maritimus TaxID=762213 RepID=A0A3N4UM04_9RHOB|nr:LysR family transcriptional regulator [Pacificibacter maritimus]RPE71602.1 LysR family transcriptional regulator [Pacificibacter maritimus]